MYRFDYYGQPWYLKYVDWEILFYISPGGQPVVQKFLDALPEPAHSKTLRQLDLLEKYGTKVGMPHARAMGDGLIELRVRGKQEVRVFYAFVSGRRIYLVHGFIKKTQVTPKKELEIARHRKKEIQDI